MTAAHSLLVAPFETLGFMRSALVACLALALANGVVGTLLLLRRSTKLAYSNCRVRSSPGLA